MSDDQFNTLLVHLVQARANQAVIMSFLSTLVPDEDADELMSLSRMEMACLLRPGQTRGRTREEQRNTTHEEPS